VLASSSRWDWQATTPPFPRHCHIRYHLCERQFLNRSVVSHSQADCAALAVLVPVLVCQGGYQHSRRKSHRSVHFVVDNSWLQPMMAKSKEAHDNQKAVDASNESMSGSTLFDLTQSIEEGLRRGPVLSPA
jgi:hypothetical protein